MTALEYDRIMAPPVVPWVNKVRETAANVRVSRSREDKILSREQSTDIDSPADRPTFPPSLPACLPASLPHYIQAVRHAKLAKRGKTPSERIGASYSPRVGKLSPRTLNMPKGLRRSCVV